MSPTPRLSFSPVVVVSVVLAALLSGCSCGPGPTANAGPDFSARSGTVVRLAGTGTAADEKGKIVEQSWRQVSGTEVDLATGDGVTVFVAPILAESEPLTFELTVKDDAGRTGSNEVVVTVIPVMDAPEELFVAATTEVVQLSWTPVPGAGGYRVARCDVPAEGPATEVCLGSDVDTCASFAFVTEPRAEDRAPAPELGSCYRVQTCYDPAGLLCGRFNANSKHGQLNPVPVPRAFISVPSNARTFPGRQTILHGYARDVDRAVTYQWKTPAGLSLCPGTDKTKQDLCFLGPSVTTTRLLQFEFSVFEAGVFASKAKASVSAEPEGNLSVRVDDTRRVRPGDEVSLHALGQGGTRYQWVQTGPVDPATGAVSADARVELIDANTGNPRFVAPPGLEAGELTFVVTYVDDAGRLTEERYVVGSAAPAPTTGGEQPLSSSNGDPRAPIPPQKLAVFPPPAIDSYSGAYVQLPVTAVHGTPPYTFAWTQVEGPAVTNLSGATGAVVSFNAPLVTAPTNLVFSVVVGDGAAQRTAEVTVHVAPPLPPAGPPRVPPQPVLQPPRIVNRGATETIETALKDPTVVQLLGPSVGPISNGGTTASGGTSFGFTVPSNAPVGSVVQLGVTSAQGRRREVHTFEIEPNRSAPRPVELEVQAGVGLVLATTLRDARLQQTSGTAVASVTPSPRTDGGKDFVIDLGLPDGEAVSFTILGDNASGLAKSERYAVLVVPAASAQVKTATRPPAVTLGGSPLQLGTRLRNVQVAQTAGVAGTLGTATESPTGATFTFTPAVATADAYTAELTITGVDGAKGIRREVQPIRVVRPWTAVTPSLAPRVVPKVGGAKAGAEAPTLPLFVVSCGMTRAEAGQAAQVVLGACAHGGTGTYTYKWTLASAVPAGTRVTLEGDTTATPRFSAPSITSGRGSLTFQVEVDDGKTKATIPATVAVYAVGQTAVSAATPMKVTAEPGHEVTLHAPVPIGGQPPYTYTLTSFKDGAGMDATSALSPTGTDGDTWLFTPARAPAAGTTERYVGVWTVRDAVGNSFEEATVVDLATAPDPAAQGPVDAGVPTATPVPPPAGTPPLVVSLGATALSAVEIDAIETAQQTVQANVQGIAPGSTVSYAWGIQCSAALPNRNPSDWFSPGTAPGTACPDTASRVLPGATAGQTLTLPFVAPPVAPVDMPMSVPTKNRETMTLSVLVTESVTGRTATATLTLTVESPRRGSRCYTCGDYKADPKVECTRIQIVTRHKEICPTAKPYCMNDIFQAAGESPKLYKRCADEREVKELWFMQSSDKVACFQYDSSTFRDDLVCHLGCYGDDCNANALPPQETLYAP